MDTNQDQSKWHKIWEIVEWVGATSSPRRVTRQVASLRGTLTRNADYASVSSVVRRVYIPARLSMLPNQSPSRMLSWCYGAYSSHPIIKDVFIVILISSEWFLVSCLKKCFAVPRSKMHSSTPSDVLTFFILVVDPIRNNFPHCFSGAQNLPWI